MHLKYARNRKPTGPLSTEEEAVIRRRVDGFWAHSELVRLLATLDAERAKSATLQRSVELLSRRGSPSSPAPREPRR